MTTSTYRSYERRAFARERCTLCGDCFHLCPVMHLPLAQAQHEMEAVLAGQDSPVLRSCTSCQACNQFCPEDCRPANLIIDLWHDDYTRRGLPVRAAYFLPHSRPNFRSDIIAQLPVDERATVAAWRRDEPASEFLYSGCNLVTVPYLTYSRVFDGIEIRGGLDYCCGEMLFRMGLYEPLEEVARRLSNWFHRLGARRVYLVCTAGVNMLRHVLPQFGADLEGIEFLPYLPLILERLEAGEYGQIHPLDMTVTVQDSCHARHVEAVFAGLPRRLLEAIGVEVQETPHSQDQSLCCGIGGGFSHLSAFHPADLLLSARATSRDQLRTPADATCVYCAGCLEMMSVARFVNPNRRPVFHILELVQLAIGETPHRRQGALARQFILGSVRRQSPSLLRRQRFWLPSLPIEPDGSEAL